ncbi:hypothetical protein [Amycolatopsis thermoflava]|uniref:hypothetical protein n=1 Tax=Amycolatopsis thermoflava TaxID=84480 RepID=UPI003665B231
MRTALETLTRAFWGHLRDFPLPEPCRVTLHPGVPEIQVQVAPGEAGTHLAELLLWAYTLDQVTATWWRTEQNNLHITIRGRSQGGAHFLVYGGVAWRHCGGLVQLANGAREGVSVDELYTLRMLLDEQAVEVAA